MASLDRQSQIAYRLMYMISAVLITVSFFSLDRGRSNQRHASYHLCQRHSRLPIIWRSPVWALLFSTQAA